MRLPGLTVVYVAGRVAYDGTDYCGYQYQVNVPTIQGELERALAEFTDLEGRVLGSGRTDTGVHASGQVIAVHAPWQHDPADLQRAWNVRLPRSIQVRALREASIDFHPRFSAVARTYRYTVDVHAGSGENGAPPKFSPLTERYALFVPYALNLDAMQRASACLVGEHDFATFGRPPQGENTVRTIFLAEWSEAEQVPALLSDSPSRRYVFTICANAFLYRMVRSIVGTLLEIGRGKRSVGTMQAALDARDRSRAASPAPPHGLTLERVDYPADLTPWPADGSAGIDA